MYNKPLVLVIVMLAGLFALSACGGIGPAPAPTVASMEKPAVTEAVAPVVGGPTQAAPSTGDKPPASGQVGSTWKSPKDGMEMVFVPAGEFLMGSRDFDKAAEKEEFPMHTVNLDAFWIDKTEVTHAMFAQFLSEMGSGATVPLWYEPDSNSAFLFVEGPKWVVKEGKENMPVIEVSWEGARAYCEWAGRRLPTEAEWEKAARGTDGRIYPWGNGDPSCSMANMFQGEKNQPCAGKGTLVLAPVGSYPSGASPYGALDMAGNVWEWVADWFKPNFYASSPADNPKGADSGDGRGYRGGSFESGARLLRTAQRKYDIPTATRYFLGFRCAVTP